MKKILLVAMCLGLVAASACTPSPTAVTVGGRKVDASEYAFYLNQNKPALTGDSYSEAATDLAREEAIGQIITNEVIRLKCKELGLAPDNGQEAALKETKEQLVETLGGKAAYLEYLNSHFLTDRCYDKFQLNQVYYRLLYTHVTEELEQERYTDENMRRLFAENYIRVKYIKLNLVDGEGAPLAAAQLTDKKYLAEYIHMELTQGEAEFADMIEGLGEDPLMAENPDGIVISRQEAAGQEHLLAAFELERGEISPVIETPDACYIVTRLEVPAGYYEANEAVILRQAQAAFFSEALAGWKEEVTVTVSKVVDKIDLNNLAEYVK